jgi:mono/diheme cytochrome c family protein
MHVTASRRVDLHQRRCVALPGPARTPTIASLIHVKSPPARSTKLIGLTEEGVMMANRSRTSSAPAPEQRGPLWLYASRCTWLVAAALALFGAVSPAHPAAGSLETDKVERGRALYEANCRQCHTESIHRRANRMPLTRDELMGIVDHFRRTANLGWTPEEIDDVVEYLNRTQYRLGR